MLPRQRSALLFPGGSNYFSKSVVPISAVPLTFSCWVYFRSLGSTQTFIAIAVGGSANHHFSIGTVVNAGKDVAYSLARTNTSGIARGTTALATGRWYHICGVFNANNSRSVFTNGSDKQTNTVNLAPSGMDVFQIARRGNNAEAPDGALAYPAMWDVALTDDEVYQLAQGILPSEIRPDRLQGYWPPEYEPGVMIDRGLGGNDLTQTGDVHLTAGPPYFADIRTPAWYAEFAQQIAAGDTSLSPGAADLLLSLQAASLDFGLAMPQGNLLLSTFAAARDIDLELIPAQGNLLLSSQAAGLDLDIPVPQGDLLLSTTAPTVDIPTGDLSLSPAQGDLILSSQAAALDFSHVVPQGDLQLSAAAASLDHGLVIPQADLSLSTAPVTLGIDMVPGQGNLTLSTFVPGISVPVARIPPQGNLTLSTFAPSITVPSAQPSADKTPVGGGGGGFYGGVRVTETERIKRLRARWRAETTRAEDLRANLRSMIEDAPTVVAESEPVAGKAISAPLIVIEAAPVPDAFAKEQRRRFKRLQRRLREVSEGLRALDREIRAAEALAARTDRLMAEDEAAATVLLLY